MSESLRRRVVFNGLPFCLDRQAGVHRYARELLKRLDGSPIANEIAVLIPEGTNPNIDLSRIEVLQHGKLTKKLKRTLWQQITLVNYIRDNNAIGVDLMLGLPRSDASFVAIHDCIKERFPQNAASVSAKIRRREYIRRVKAVMKSNAEIITVSEYSKRELCDLYNCDPERVRIVPNGWEHMMDIPIDQTIHGRLRLEPKSYFFALGTRSYHKNHRWIVEAARSNPNLKFVVTGGGDDSPSDVSNLLYTGYLSDAEVKALMIGATALIEPSFAEGFGIPPLEALSLGTPAIVSNTTCLPEVYGPYVHYLDPYDFSFDFTSLKEVALPNPQPLLEQYSWNVAANQLASLLAAKL